jgi:hypothetical protein
MEVPEKYLEQARERRLDILVSDMRHPGENSEWLWQEIERILASSETADRDSIEDMTLADLIDRVCEAKVDKEMDNGDLDEDAMSIAIEDAESRYDRDMDR